MNMKTKLINLEKLVEKRNTPTQEDAVCSYLRLVFDKDSELEQMETNYNKVSKFIPKMHFVN